jgi:hypothetical protein
MSSLSGTEDDVPFSTGEEVTTESVDETGSSKRASERDDGHEPGLGRETVESRDRDLGPIDKLRERLTGSRKTRQLDTKIAITALELERLETQLEGHSSVGPNLEACESHLEIADIALHGPAASAVDARTVRNTAATSQEMAMAATYAYARPEDVVAASQALFAAKRELIYLNYFAAKHLGDDAVPSRDGTLPEERVIEQEATKLLIRAENELSGWPLYAIANLLTEDGSTVRVDLDINAVIQARQMYDEQALKQIELVDILEGQNKVFRDGSLVAIVSVVALGLVVPYLNSFTTWLSGWFGGFEPGTAMLGLFGPFAMEFGPIFYVTVAMFGLLGASVSGMFSLRGVSPTARSSAPIDLENLAKARLLIGVGAAVALVTLVESGLPELVLAFPVEFTSAPMVLVVAFAAGWSERLLLRAMDKLVGDKTEPTDVQSLFRFRSGPAVEQAPTAERRTE